MPFKVQPNTDDQHLPLRFPLSTGKNTLTIQVKNDFGLAVSSELPALGSASRGLRVLSESWNASKTEWTLEVSGLASHGYEMGVWNAGEIASVDGAVLTKASKLEIHMPEGPPSSYVQQRVVIHFNRH